jgi:hypothetical protein
MSTVVWTVHPRFQTITVHRPNVAPHSFDSFDVLEGGPELPGFSVPMKDVFKIIVGGVSLSSGFA